MTKITIFKDISTINDMDPNIQTYRGTDSKSTVASERTCEFIRCLRKTSCLTLKISVTENNEICKNDHFKASVQK